ncbi:MarR family winged helix-turn-helix transcriptional regulator [Sinomonas sp. P47F7]|uniref:MarR family winged helix-turn-helix transcriptional regulator n=1 Tax=Sinomonas sp. P47F7 TaxID=3410987 RepID=UPI003BF4D70A
MLSREDHARVNAYRLLMADVYELAALSRRSSDSVAAAHGVTVTQWHTMSVLSGGDATVPAIARRLGITRQAVQRTTDQLEAVGHVQALPNPEHRGSPLMHLTRSGHDTLQRLWSASDRPRAEALRSIPTDRLAAARETVRDILAAIGNPLVPPASKSAGTRHPSNHRGPQTGP